MQRSPPPSFVGIVVHVIVNQRRGVDQFEGQRKGHDVVPIDASGGVVGEHEEHRAKPLSSAHEDMSRHGHDLATPRRFSVIEQGFEPCINLLLETGKSLDLP